MKVGGKHSWRYTTGKWKETKISPRKWTFTYTQSKTRTGSWAKEGQGMPTGSKLIWRIQAKQYAVKVSPNTYKLVMKGVKFRERWKTPKRRWKK